MLTPPDELYLTVRESDILVQQAARRNEERIEAHRREHEQQADAIDKALGSDKAQSAQHNIAHDKAHDAHEEKHAALDEAVKTALNAVSRERSIHAEAHEREHAGHQREHGMADQAIGKAEAANDKRFAVANGVRESFEARVQQSATKETVESMRKEFDRRFEDFRKERDVALDGLRRQVTTLEKTDVKAEGRGIGQGAVIAFIVTGVGLISTLVGMVVIFTR